MVTPMQETRPPDASAQPLLDGQAAEERRTIEANRAQAMRRLEEIRDQNMGAPGAKGRWLLRHRPQQEREEVSIIYQAKGIPPADADRLADHVMRDPATALDLMAREELGLDPDALGSPWAAAIGSFCAFAVGAVVPLLPFLVFGPSQALVVALVVAAVVLFTVGGFTARLSNRPVLFGGARMLLIGGLATGVT